MRQKLRQRVQHQQLKLPSSRPRRSSLFPVPLPKEEQSLLPDQEPQLPA